jgi:DNA-binding transcriptional MerR regulator/methylmalonyl-CoA mutase cobalamin-binding subunit
MSIAEDSSNLPVNIAVAERETGLGKDTLRVWERRYGFPRPVRYAHGDRAYPRDQIERLRQIKRLLDSGHRPGRIVGATDEELQRLTVDAPRSAVPEPADAGRPDDEFQPELLALRAHDFNGLRWLLSQRLARNGLERMVTETLPHLNHAVGDAWSNGRLAIYEEHLYTEQVKSLLRQAIGALPPGTQPPRVLLGTVPGEQHILGLLMVEALLALRGIQVVSLGAQTPLGDLAAAARAHRADIVALSFSAAFPARQLVPVVKQLHDLLPAPIRLWIGGAGCRRYAGTIPGVEHLVGFGEIDRLLPGVIPG